MKRYHLFILAIMIILAYTSCSYDKGKAEAPKSSTISENKANMTDPPEISITSSGKKIPCVVGLNHWNGAVYDREDVFQSIMKKDSGIKVPYIKLGENIVLAIQGTAPDRYVLKDYILNKDGRPKYTEKEVNAIPIKLIDGKGTIKLDMHIAALLSSNSKDYEPGNTIRGFQLTCSWDENECEYGFIVRTDAYKTKMKE